jgi:hypothetical protein
MIPKILIQSTKDSIPEKVQQMIKKQLSDEWEYYIFNDEDSIKFFKDNPLDEFPNIVQVFNSFTGAHKSDLFRYYFTYINGGVFLDDDAMVYVPFDDIIDGCDCFFMIAYHHHMTLLFNGFYGVEPNNKIIYECLKNAYSTPSSKLDHNDPIKYLRFTRTAHIYYTKYKSMYNVKEFTEVCLPESEYAYLEKDSNIFFKHFYRNKQVLE